MEEIIDKIMSIRGVLGCYVYSPSKGVKIKRGYPEEEELSGISKELSKIFNAFGANDNKPRLLHISYDKGEITLKRASEYLIVVFHTPKIDISLLRIALNVASYRIKAKGQLSEIQKAVLERLK
jgi:predicted regulator of Ras-like GTPase activity (Roadblock/LC7/MglB family)